MYRHYSRNRSPNIELNGHQTISDYPLHSQIRYSHNVPKSMETASLESHINSKDSEGNTPLHLAVERGYAGWTKYLVDHDADVNISNSYGLTPLMLAVRHEHSPLVLFLLNKGADVHRTNKEGQIALHYAACSGNSLCMEYLLQNKSRINHQDKEGITPLLMACKMQKWTIVNLLLNHKSTARINPNLSDHQGRSPLHWAVEVGNSRIVEALLSANAQIDAKDNDMETPFVRAIKQNRLEAFDVLINAGCDRNDIDGLNGTAMTMASLLGRYHIIERLINLGEDVNEVGHIGFTPLTAAVFECQVDCVRLLLDNGADPNLVARIGCNPLIEVCKFFKNCRADQRHEIAKLLLRANANPNQRITMAGFFTSCTNGRNCALSYAITSGLSSMVKMMLIGGAKVTLSEISEWIHINEVENDNNCVIIKNIYEYVKDPEPLKILTRRVIRQRLGFMIHKKISLLPVPNIIQQYLDLEELDWVPVSSTTSAKIEITGQLPGYQMIVPCGLRTLQGTLSYEVYGDGRLMQ